MLTAAILLGIVAAPTVLFRVVMLLFRAAQRYLDAHRPPTATGHPIERITADLRRLRVQVETRENGPDKWGKGVRMRGVREAYVRALTDACRQLDVPPPRPGRNSHELWIEIYRVEAALRHRGLDVRLPREGGQRYAA